MHPPTTIQAARPRGITTLKRCALSMAFASVLSACGGGGSDDAEPPAPPPPPTVPAPEPPPAPPPPAGEPVQPNTGNYLGADVMNDTQQRVEGVIGEQPSDVPPLHVVAGDLPNLASVFAAPGYEQNAVSHAGTPYAIHMQPDGGVMYLDRVAMQIVRVLPDGRVLRQLSPGRPDGGAAQGFWSPTAFAVDAAGNAYVADGWKPGGYVCMLICFVDMPEGVQGDKAWAGIWKISPEGAITRLAGVVAGDTMAGGMVDGDRDTAQFSAIGQMETGPDGKVYVLDHQRYLSMSPNGYHWRAPTLRRIDVDGNVTSIRAERDGVSLVKGLDGNVSVLERLSGAEQGYRQYDVVAGTERTIGLDEGDALVNLGRNGWRRSIDSAGNTWVMDHFHWGDPVTGITGALPQFLAVGRYGADGAFRSGSMMLNWDCKAPNPYINESFPSTCGKVAQLGLASDGQLMGVIANAVVRVDVQALLPK